MKVGSLVNTKPPMRHLSAAVLCTRYGIFMGNPCSCLDHEELRKDGANSRRPQQSFNVAVGYQAGAQQHWRRYHQAQAPCYLQTNQIQHSFTNFTETDKLLSSIAAAHSRRHSTSQELTQASV
jgi:hypothetical protein